MYKTGTEHIKWLPPVPPTPKKEQASICRRAGSGHALAALQYSGKGSKRGKSRDAGGRKGWELWSSECKLVGAVWMVGVVYVVRAVWVPRAARKARAVWVVEAVWVAASWWDDESGGGGESGVCGGRGAGGEGAGGSGHALAAFKYFLNT